MLLTVFLVLCGLLASVAASLPPVRLSQTDTSIILENGFLYLSVDKLWGRISTIKGDFKGTSTYGANALAKPYSLQVAINGTNSLLCSKSEPASGDVKLSIVSETDDLVSISLSGINDCATNPSVSESWNIQLARGQRAMSLSVEGQMLQSAALKYISHGLYSAAASQYGLFDQGVVQMMNNAGHCFASTHTLPRMYWIAGKGRGLSLDIQRDFDTNSKPRDVFMLSSDPEYESALIDYVVGDYKVFTSTQSDRWTTGCNAEVNPTNMAKGDKWNFKVRIGANNMDFPAFAASDVSSQAALRDDIDLQTYLTGIYPNSVGCLQSYKNDGSVAPTISTPLVGYAPSTNFFDPDNFITLTALMLSGDSYLIDQARRVIERTASTMCGVGSAQLASYCGAPSTRRMVRQRRMLDLPIKGFVNENPRTGQLMHHFNEMVPTYESLAGSEQLGPNIFWTLTALKYAGITGNISWLKKMFPFIDASTKFIASFYDDDMKMLHVPGPLWIDVIVRENFTSDSNAIAPYIFRLLADTYDMLGENKEFADHMRDLANQITTSMNANLWDKKSDDHYITQLNNDGSIRDFVDYDSALIAVAFGVTPEDRVSKLITRVDKGNYTHVRATYPCEIPYSGDANDCYIVGGTVCGDSIVTMGRIGWVDALARKRIGDKKTFDDLLLKPIQNDLLKDTWLYERYDKNGLQTRTPYYFEYPSLVTMLLAEVRYGINFLPNSITISPFTPEESFKFRFGEINVEYSRDLVSISLMGDNTSLRTIIVSGLYPNQSYSASKADACSTESQTVSTDATGSISFKVVVNSDCPIVIKKSV